MDTKSANKVNAIRTTTQFCSTNSAATSGISAFAGVLTTAKNKLTLIDNYDLIATSTTKGVTLDTKAIRKTMESIAFKCSRAVIAYASQAPVNNTLIAKVKFSKSDLSRALKEDIANICETIRVATNANIAAVTPFGVVAADVTDLGAAITLYNSASPNPKQAKIEKNFAIKQIKVLIKQVNQDIFKNSMDNMVLTLETSHPDFVDKYFKARAIIDLGTTKTKFRADAIIKAAGPLANVKATLRKAGQSAILYTSISNAAGVFKNVIVIPDTYDITYECPGYITQSENNFSFPPGFEKIHHIEMIPV